MNAVLAASLGLVMAGPPGALIVGLLPTVWPLLGRRSEPDPPLTLILLLLLVEIRSGLSVLASLRAVAATLPDYRNLAVVSRVALVSGLLASLPHADERLRPVVAQLARAQRSGASLTSTVRRMLDTEMSAAKARRIARARTLPVRLMVPVTLIMLPGLILFLYAPSLLGMFEDLTGSLT